MEDRNLIYYPVHLTSGYEVAIKANQYVSGVRYCLFFNNCFPLTFKEVDECDYFDSFKIPILMIRSNNQSLLKKLLIFVMFLSRPCQPLMHFNIQFITLNLIDFKNIKDVI